MQKASKQKSSSETLKTVTKDEGPSHGSAAHHDGNQLVEVSEAVQRSVIQSVIAQYDSVNAAVLALYMYQLQLKQHLTTCRQYLLWASGDVNSTLANEMIEVM